MYSVRLIQSLPVFRTSSPIVYFLPHNQYIDHFTITESYCLWSRGFAGPPENRLMSAWSRAAELADRTPASRNRYVDFLRALSMLVVVVGHWLAAAPYLDANDNLISSHILTEAPWTAWLTWI